LSKLLLYFFSSNKSSVPLFANCYLLFLFKPLFTMNVPIFWDCKDTYFLSIHNSFLTFLIIIFNKFYLISYYTHYVYFTKTSKQPSSNLSFTKLHTRSYILTLTTWFPCGNFNMKSVFP